jgi:hypothetical protein
MAYTDADTLITPVPTAYPPDPRRRVMWWALCVAAWAIVAGLAAAAAIAWRVAWLIMHLHG